MEVRYQRCDDPELRTVLEVFAAERLGTKTYEIPPSSRSTR